MHACFYLTPRLYMAEDKGEYIYVFWQMKDTGFREDVTVGSTGPPFTLMERSHSDFEETKKVNIELGSTKSDVEVNTRLNYTAFNTT